MSQPRYVAVLGGDGRTLPQGCGSMVRVYKSGRCGGNGELRRLEAALRSGGIDEVWILARWNSHSVTRRVRRLCRRLRIVVEVLP